MARPKRSPIVFGTRDARFRRERERVLTLPELGDWERSPSLAGIMNGSIGIFMFVRAWRST